MRSFWVQIVTLSLYFEIVIVVSRLWDLVLWYQQGAPPTQVVDPLLLSVRQLKLLLDSRGVNYTGYLDKVELAQLVSDSAEVVNSEVEQLVHSSQISNEVLLAQKSSHFTSRGHFYEEVEDSRDSVWLVQVVASDKPLLDDHSWRTVCSQVEPFAIRTGVFDCHVDQRLCDSKGWRQPLLLLAMPKGTKPKDKVILRTFFSKKPLVIMDWVRQQLSVWVKQLKNVDEVKKDWLHLTDQAQARVGEDTPISERSLRTVQVLLLSHLLHPPLFLVALSIKFSGRVRFGMLTVRKEDAETVRRELKLPNKTFPCYLIITPEQTVVYGKRRLEHFNFWSMNLFLRTIQPEMNDVFLCSLVLVNMLVILQSLQVSAQPRWRVIAKCVWLFMTHNLLLFSTWLIFLAAARFQITTFLAEKLLFIVRGISLSSFGSLLRADCCMVFLHPISFALSFIAFAVCASFSLPADTESDRQHWWEVFPNDSYWVNCLFGNMASLSHSLQPSFGDMDYGLEEFIARLPNNWLQTSVPREYVAELPVWKFHCDNCHENPSNSLRDSSTVARKSATGNDGDPSVLCSCLENHSIHQCQGRCCDCSANLDPDWGRNGCEKCGRFCKRLGNRPSADCDCHSSVSDESGREDLFCNPPPWMLTTTMCAICLETYHEGSKLCGLPCGHNYHHRCISVWILKDNHHCPICRWPAYQSKSKSQVDHRHSD